MKKVIKKIKVPFNKIKLLYLADIQRFALRGGDFFKFLCNFSMVFGDFFTFFFNFIDIFFCFIEKYSNFVIANGYFRA